MCLMSDLCLCFSECFVVVCFRSVARGVFVAIVVFLFLCVLFLFMGIMKRLFVMFFFVIVGVVVFVFVCYMVFLSSMVNLVVVFMLVIGLCVRVIDFD